MSSKKSLIERWSPEVVMLDPVARDLFSARGLPMLLVTALILRLFERAGYIGGALRLFALFTLVAAAPISALILIESETSGRLDQLRLFGLTTRKLAVTVLKAGVVPFGLGGLALLSFADWQQSVRDFPFIVIAFANASALSMAAVLVGVVRPGAARGMAAAVVIAALGFAIFMNTLGDGLGRLSTTAIAAGVVTPALIVAGCFPVLLPVLQRSRARRASSRPIGEMLPAATLPEITRNARAVLPGALIATTIVLAGGAAVGLDLMQAGDDAEPLPFVPLLIALIMILVAARADAASNRLEILRAAPVAPVWMVTQSVLGWLLPFMPAVAAGLAIAAANGQVSMPMIGSLVVVALVAPAMAVEGWLAPSAQHLVGVGTALPLVFALIAFQRADAQPWLVLATVGWIPLAAAAGVFARPTKVAPSLPVQLAMVAGIAACLFGAGPFNRNRIFMDGFFLPMILLALAPLLAATRASDRVRMAVTIVGVTLAAGALRSQSLMAVTVAALGGVAALAVGWHVERIATRVIALQARLMLAYLIFMAALSPGPVDMYDLPWFSRPLFNDPLFLAIRIAGLLIMAAVIVTVVRVYTRYAQVKSNGS